MKTRVSSRRARRLPTGTVTFLFTDIEGSTRLARELGAAYDDVLRDHHALLRDTFRGERGSEVRTAGDSFFVAFSRAAPAVAAAVAAQRALAAHEWPDGVTVRVRMGLHTGEGPLAADDYGGLDVNRAARIAAAAHGGQILISGTTSSLVELSLPAGAELRDLGEHRLKDLERPERLFQVVIAGLERDFPPVRSLSPAVGNLPLPLTTFVGRERELDELQRLLDEVRSVTLVGPGGTGKTRLSIELARSFRQKFHDGAFFVPLASVRDETLVASTIGRVLGLQESGTQPIGDRLLGHLQDRQTLLVLDNFEQLIGAATFVSELLAAAPRVKVIVTSRAPLHVAGEHQYPVEPLRLPPVDAVDPDTIGAAEAVKLFVDRARAHAVEFVLDGTNGRVIAELCARLDGLPLAIELAAARTRTLTPEAMVRRIDRRLDSLMAAGRDMPARQSTLRATIAWSHDLLDEPERRLFARLSVFSGGARLDDAELVCGPPDEIGRDVAETAASLVDHSLLRQDVSAGEPRLQMLETIREFAAERLAESGEDAEVRRRHGACFLELAERAEPELMASDPVAWVDRLERDHDNIRAALDWLVTSQSTQSALRLPAVLWRFWQMSGRLEEGLRRTEQALALPGADRYPVAMRRALEAAGGLAYWQGRFEIATRHYERALHLARQSGDEAAIANALYNLPFAMVEAFQTGDPTSARWRAAIADLEESLALYTKLDDRSGQAKVLWALSEAARTSGAVERATTLIKDCLAAFRELGDEFQIGWALWSLTLLERRRGDRASAVDAASEGLGLFHARNDATGVLMFLSVLARLALDVGDIDRGIRLAGAASVLQLSSGANLVDATYDFTGASWEEALASLGDEARETWNAGARMSADEAVAYALRRPTPGPPGA